MGAPRWKESSEVIYFEHLRLREKLHCFNRLYVITDSTLFLKHKNELDRTLSLGF